MSIDELLEGAVANNVAPGFAAVIGDRDGVVVEATAGTARPDTLFRIASMTKAMTSGWRPAAARARRAGPRPAGRRDHPRVRRPAGARGLRRRPAAPAAAGLSGAHPPPAD